MKYQNSLYRIKEQILSGELEARLGYYFYNKELLIKALTHKSYTYYFKKEYTSSNERLEFLGDSVLGLIISEFLINKMPAEHEGKLTKIKSFIVSETSLYKVAENIGIERYILLGKSEFSSQNHDKSSIISDAVEAIIGAIYLDGGIEGAKKFIIKHFKKIIEKTIEEGLFIDYKSFLQEVIQKKYKSKPSYKVVKEEGPEHKKIFYVITEINGKEYGTGKGRNKKEAEQHAAKATLEIIKQKE